MADEEFTVTVDGQDHKFGDLEANDQQVVAHLKDLDNQLAQLNFRQAQLNASKAFFSDQLVGSLAKKNEENAAAAESSDAADSSQAESSEEKQESASD